MTRNGQQKEKFLSSDFKEVLIDPFLLRLEHPSVEPGFTDPRHCLVFWARPPEHIIKLASKIQSLLKEAAPSTSMDSLSAHMFWGLTRWTPVHLDSDIFHVTMRPDNHAFYQS